MQVQIALSIAIPTDRSLVCPISFLTTAFSTYSDPVTVNVLITLLSQAHSLRASIERVTF